MSRIRILTACALATLLAGVGIAQPPGDAGLAKQKDAAAPQDKTATRWVYFVCNDPLFATFTVDNTGGNVQYTAPYEGEYVVTSMKLKYLGEDGSFYKYQNDVMAGGLMWALPKAKYGEVYWAYGGTGTTEWHSYGRSTRFHSK